MPVRNPAASRRLFLQCIATGLASLPFAGVARAGGLGGLPIGGVLGDVLGKASDSALDKLAQPDAFYNDPAVRIGLPLLGGGNSSLLKMAGKLGLFDGLTRKLNTAAGVAAGVAKPVFREAIGELSLNDVPGIVSHDDGATRYLQESAGDTLKGKLRPLVDDALGNVGAYRSFDKLSRKSSLLSAAGLTHDILGKSVTEQALSGIFKYIGHEEAKLRADPLGKVGGLLKGVLGN